MCGRDERMHDAKDVKNSLRERVAEVLDEWFNVCALDAADALISARMVCTPEEREVLEAAKKWRASRDMPENSEAVRLFDALAAAYPPAPPKPRYVVKTDFNPMLTRVERDGVECAWFKSWADAESYAAQKNAEGK